MMAVAIGKAANPPRTGGTTFRKKDVSCRVRFAVAAFKTFQFGSNS
jgi:hypothetical protein